MSVKSLLRVLISSENIVKARVLLKSIIRVIKGEKKIVSKYDFVSFGGNETDTFFGYYDISPFNSLNDLLYNEVADKKNCVRIVKNSIDNTNKEIISESKAWNWQQGCRLRWFAGSDYIISFNDFDGRSYFNRIINLVNKEERRIDYPLYDIDNRGLLGLSVNFERLGYLRPGYGYTCRPYVESDLTKESIKLISIRDNRIIDEISYLQISEIFKESSIDLSNCYINHLCFSPSGKRFLFFWIQILNGFHKASLIVYDINEKRLIPIELEYKVSHYLWDGEDSIICTAYDDDYNCRYYRYIVGHEERIILSPNSLSSDGHPSFFTSKNELITDTYPDSSFYQHLMIADIQVDSVEEILRIFSDPFVRGEKRTDLHPRLNSDKSLICFDANVSNHRKMYVIKL